MRRLPHTICSAITVALASWTAPALAQDVPAPTGKQKPVPQLELGKDPMVDKGRVAAIRGQVGPDGVRYTVPSLSILQPVVVMLLARESDDVTLSLCKKDWQSPLRTGSTRGTGMASFEFRTEGGLNILVRPPMPDAVVTPEQLRKRKPSKAGALEESDTVPAAAAIGSPTGAWLFAAALAAGAIVFVVARGFSGRKPS
jgi:hypothetical protein